MIAEKSVNCSLISLEPSREAENLKLPYCGPLEGLALMYVLREQGALVTANSSVLQRFESTLTNHCPEECEQQYFEPIINSDSLIDGQTALRFGALRTQDLAVLEMRYRTEEYIQSWRLIPSVLISIEKLSIVTGVVCLIMLLIFSLNQLGKQRQGLKFR